MNLHYTNPRTIHSLSVRCKYTTCCTRLSSHHLMQLLSNHTVDPHNASHLMFFYLRDCTPFPSHFIELRITYNRDRDILRSPPLPHHLFTQRPITTVLFVFTLKPKKHGGRSMTNNGSPTMVFVL